ncbi:NAD-dependent epimerase/dehydratase family protein [Pedobacter sp. UBA4863]|uniref:NAD-dependent epimerase/dehydratase family protein n=1 Tax=Pedobacter sp. UBA4863 TaxID=1947060 RepID=UPI0025E9F569|nr:NAD-dependent epimerase/dehydratase family protein [Pedobacter sp. UBA4863]
MKKFLQTKETVLLIGGTGFIGKNIIDYVLNNKTNSVYKFIVLSRHLHTERCNSVEYVVGDYSNVNLLMELFTRWKFTKVFHCATSTTPLSSGNNILGDINGNLIATIGLLDVMKHFDCKHILYLSSGGAVYGEKKVSLISENEICYPMSSYGVVKLTIENYLRLYQKQYGINYLILRISNPFGKFHTSEKQGVINIAIRRALRGELVEVWGNGSQSKDYIYVDILVKFIFQVVESNCINKTLNVGSGETHSLNSILDVIKLYLPDLRVKYLDSKITDVKDFCLNISLLKSFVDFEVLDFKDTIQKTIAWEMTNL